MINLLLLYDQMNATTEVNLCGIKSLYGDDRHTIKVMQSKNVTSDDLNWCDACLANRPSSVYMVRISHSIKKSGRVFMSLIDDDLLHLPKGNSGRWKSRYVIKCLEKSDIIITPNPLISDSYKRIVSTPKYVVVDTHILEEEIKAISSLSERIRLIYAAGSDHTELFNRFIKPFMDSLSEKYPSKLEFTLLGVHPDLSDLVHCDWVNQIGTLPYNQYKEYMRNHDFDIGIAPLHDDSFSNRKYFNKYFEYTKNGIVGLYSNCLPYTLVIKNMINGILVENTVDAWYRALCNAIDNVEQMKDLVREAQCQLRTNYSINTIRNVVYNEIDSYILEHNKKGLVLYRHSLWGENRYELLSRWHQFTSHIYKKGLIGTIKKVIGNVRY